MSLNGKIIKLDSGKFAIECLSTRYDKPEATRHVWEVENFRATGFVWGNPDDAIGRDAAIESDVRATVSCYLGNGQWFNGYLKDGGATKAVTVETTAVPPPKVRAGVETRWHGGRWQKYLKRDGWVNA